MNKVYMGTPGRCLIWHRWRLVLNTGTVVIGYGVALASQLAVFPLFDINVSLQDNLAIGAYFTAISIARSYAIRRWFSRRTEQSRRLS